MLITSTYVVAHNSVVTVVSKQVRSVTYERFSCKFRFKCRKCKIVTSRSENHAGYVQGHKICNDNIWKMGKASEKFFIMSFIDVEFAIE